MQERRVTDYGPLPADPGAAPVYLGSANIVSNYVPFKSELRQALSPSTPRLSIVSESIDSLFVPNFFIFGDGFMFWYLHVAFAPSAPTSLKNRSTPANR